MDALLLSLYHYYSRHPGLEKPLAISSFDQASISFLFWVDSR